MQKLLSGEAHVAVNQSPEFLVGEVVADLSTRCSRQVSCAYACLLAYLLDQSATDQLFQGRHHLFVASTADIAHHFKVERSSDDGRGVQHLPAGLANAFQTRAEEVSGAAGK